jgi:hypothetical protein
MVELAQSFSRKFASFSSLLLLEGRGMVYRPAFLGSYEVRYSSARHNVEETQSIQVIVDLEDGPIPFSLDRAQTIELPTDLLDTAPVEGVALPHSQEKLLNHEVMIAGGKSWFAGYRARTP